MSAPPSSRWRVPLGLADTSLFIAQEQQRPLAGEPPERIAVSVVTVGELRLGVLAANEPAIRAQRLETLTRGGSPRAARC